MRLRADRVHISAAVSRAVSAPEAAGLRRAVREMPVSTRVAILSGPPNNFDVEGLSLYELPELLGGAVDRPALYVVADATGRARIHMSAVGVRTRVAAEDAERALDDDVAREERVAQRIRYALRVAATGARPLQDRAKRALDRELDGDSDENRENAVAIGFAGGGCLAAFTWPTVLWWRRRPQRARPDGQQAPAKAVVREPDAGVAGHAAEATTRLAAAIAAAQAPSEEAFELYSAAAKAGREARTAVDHLGALLLARDGQAAVSAEPRPRRCFFDPRHRGAITATRWRLGREETEVPACRRCARRLRAGRVPDTLGDRGKPYYEHDTVWARTGFGAIDDEVAAKVLAGR